MSYLPEGYLETEECWEKYPKLPFPENVTRGAAQKRARNACVAASMQGKADPELQTGPSILNDPQALWNVDKPWKERPSDTLGIGTKIAGRVLDPAGVFGIKTGGDFLRSVAVGWRPSSKRLGELDQKATVLGAIDALAAAGIQPWKNISVQYQNIPTLRLENDVTGPYVVQMAKEGSESLGGPRIRDLDHAARYMRRKANQEGLGAAAWKARAMRLAIAGTKAQKKRKAVESSISTAVSTAGTALTPTVIGTIPGIILTAVGLSASAASARTGIEKKRTESFADKMAQEFKIELQKRNITLQQQEIDQLKEKSERDFIQQILPNIESEAEQKARIIQGVVWVGSVSLVTVAAYLIASRVNRRD